MTFETIGIWPIRDADGTDVNAVDATDDVLAVADDNGEVLLYRYPAVHPDAEFETLMGHASHVTGVAFLQVHCNTVTSDGLGPDRSSHTILSGDHPGVCRRERVLPDPMERQRGE